MSKATLLGWMEMTRTEKYIHVQASPGTLLFIAVRYGDQNGQRVGAPPESLGLRSSASSINAHNLR